MSELDKQKETVHNAINTLFDIAKVQKAEIDLLNVDIANKQSEINDLKAKLEAAQVHEGFVLVPKECPDPIFADKLFDLLCKKAHGEFGDDQMIFFSDINESEIWEKMIEAAQGEGHE